MADWDETSPGDSDVISNYPSNARAARAAVKTNFGVDHVETDGATVGYHDKVTLPEGSDPTNVANTIIVYAKEVGGITELFARDSAGTVTQLTTNGAVNLANLSVTTAKIANDAVTYAKMQNISATDRLLGRDTTGAGDTEELTVSGGVEFSGSGGIRRSALTGDVTASAGSNTTTIANDAVTNAKLVNMAESRIKGRAAGAGTGDPTDLTPAQAADVIEGDLAINATQVTTTRSTSTTLAANQVHAVSAGVTANTGVAAGGWIGVYNNSASAITLTQGSGLTLRLSGSTSTGNRTLAARTLAVIWYNSTTEAIVSGSGVS